ncbi:MAG: CPBP family intramembrane metalloprotease [Planctomycetaceae bacterium]|jgi:membrane protease YdiL (CAAX protease family)|nr:CPBP family intramembrane metalloprotease [Planctomycetaceae bacterium]
MLSFFAVSNLFIQLLFWLICAGATAGFLIFVILWFAKNTRKGYLCQTLFPFHHHPPVTWDAADVSLILAIYFLLQIAAVSLVSAIPPQENPQTVIQQPEMNQNIEKTDAENSKEQRLEKQTVSDKELRQEHRIVIIMQKASSHPIAILVCFLSAIIIAPLTEEFIFRVIFQNGLASAIRKHGGDMTLDTMTVAKYFPILFASLFFAIIHFRATPPDDADDPLTPYQVEQFVRMMGAAAFANLLTMGTAILFLRHVRRAKWSDFGLVDFRQTGKYALGALLVLLIILLPILVLFYTIKQLFPGVVVDPFPLFFFAAILGIIYYRTQRFAAVFFLHAFFNAFNFLVLLLFL